MTKIVKVNGREIDLDRIENPKLRKIAFNSCREFLFGHSESSAPAPSHGEHKDGNVHNDVYGDYAESKTHTDEVHLNNRNHSESTKHGDYTERAHEEYRDYSDYHNDDAGGG